MPNNVSISTRTIHTLHIDIGEALELANPVIGPMDQVEVVLHSGARNREMTPIRLSYSALDRLTRDA